MTGKEKWLIWPDDPDYSVSNTGRIISRKKREPYELKGSISPKLRYRTVMIAGKRIYFHYMVATLFIGPRPLGLEVCHRDGNSLNDRVENLYWGTRSDNVQDSIRHGTWSNQR